MEITVAVEVSETRKKFTFNLSERGYSEEKFNQLSEEKKKELLQSWVDEENDQPYWVVV